MKKLLGILMLFCFIFIAKGELYAKQAKDFTLPTIGGDKISLSSLKGKKVLLDFFATWCPPCRQELKDISEIVSSYKGGNYEILCISVDNLITTVSSFWKQNNYKMTALFDDKNIANEYGVQAIPTLFLVDESGEIVWEQVGSASKSKLIEILELK